jgi:hypothetical protein
MIINYILDKKFKKLLTYKQMFDIFIVEIFRINNCQFVEKN